VKTAQQAAANWAASASRAAQDWQTGVQNYNGDWAGATTAQQGVMLNNLTQAVVSGRWAAGVNRKGTAGWKTATQNKAQNFVTGFSAGAANQAAAAAKIQAALANIVPNLPPRGDINANKARLISLVDQMHALRGQLGAP
jgi:hypothetical protein